MQNKKTLLHRLLVIYITFFIVLVASIAHNLLTDFSRGASEGFELGESIAEKWSSGTPRMIYVLNNIRITEPPECPQTAPAGQPGCELDVRVSKIDLHVEQDATGVSPLGLAFRSIGGSGWIYAMVMVCPLFYLAIIVLMFMIIHSLRRSIREERTLDRRNVWYLRTIGLLTIAVELIGNIVDWIMNRRAARRFGIHGGHLVPLLLPDDHHGHPDPFRRRGLRHRTEPQRGAEAHDINALVRPC